MSILLVLLAALGIASFFLFPRVPQIVSTNLKHLTDPGDSVSFAENGDNGGIFSLHINYLIDATVYSPNYIPWRISLLSLTGMYKVKSASTVLGSGRLSDFDLAAKSNTSLEIPFSIKKNFPVSRQDLLSKGSSNPILSDILDHCNSGPDSSFPISLELAVNIFPLHPLGYDPKFGMKTEVKCPDGLTFPS
ncbi:hypothetical protein MDAP_001286 [Mitosporidium daphniae]